MALQHGSALPVAIICAAFLLSHRDMFPLKPLPAFERLKKRCAGAVRGVADAKHDGDRWGGLQDCVSPRLGPGMVGDV